MTPGRYWIYVGGDDVRKNLSGLANAQTGPQRSRDGLPLLVVCSLRPERKRELQAAANRQGSNKILFTGFIPDLELGTLLGSAFGTVFPSLHEGLGLPVLESYSAGTPVICSQVSSLADLAPNDCKFDPYSQGSIAAMMNLAEDAPDRFREKSLGWWQSISNRYTWNFAAGQTAHELDSIQRNPSVRPPRPAKLPESTWFCALPPATTGVAVFTGRLLSAPEGPRTLVAYTNTLEPPYDDLNGKHVVVSWKDALRELPMAPTSFFVLGNSRHHTDTLRALAATASPPLANAGRRIVYTHDGHIGSLWWDYCEADIHAFHSLLKLAYPEHTAPIETTRQPSDIAAAGLHGFRLIHRLFGINEFMVHSEQAAKMIRDDVGAPGLKIHRAFLPIGVADSVPARPSSLPKADGDTTWIGTFGISSEAKGSAKILTACRILRGKGLKIRLLAAGYALPELRELMEESDHEWVTLVYAPSPQEFLGLLNSVHVAVQLRESSFGEASGVVCELLGLKKRVICTRTGWFAELGSLVDYVEPYVTPEALAAAIAQSISRERGDDRLLSRLSVGAYWQNLRSIETGTSGGTTALEDLEVLNHAPSP